jgi:hypothetical protein
MPALTDYAKNLLGRALCGRAPTLPAQVFLGLGTSASPASGLGGEPAGNGYARQRITFSGSGLQTNVDPIRFTFTAAAGVLTHVGLFDAPSGGNPLTADVLTGSINVANAGTITINPGDLDIEAI